MIQPGQRNNFSEFHRQPLQIKRAVVRTARTSAPGPLVSTCPMWSTRGRSYTLGQAMVLTSPSLTKNTTLSVLCILYILIYSYIACDYTPVVPHKAVAEVSKIGNYRRCELLWCMDGRADPLMDRKVVVIFGVVAVVTPPTTAGCSVA